MFIKELTVNISSIPALLMFKGSPEEAALKGTILFYHGLSACKENNRKELSSFAEQNFLAVGIDNVGHGERAYPDFGAKMSSKDSFEVTFLGMVEETSKEVPFIIDELINNNMAYADKIGICGISMGGYITYASILQDPRIKVATPVLGSPIWKNSIKESPHHYPEGFFPVALLSQNAGKDESVPPKYAREFHQTLTPFYKDSPERLKYIEYPESNHFMIEEDWNILWGNVVGWFLRYL